MLTERLEVRLDEEMMRRVRLEADRHGVSVGELVRTALQGYFEEDRRRRIEAAERLCSMELDWPVGPWEEIEGELYESMYEERP
jgi:plasmid stability protein